MKNNNFYVVVCAFVLGVSIGFFASRAELPKLGHDDQLKLAELSSPTREFAKTITVPMIDFEGASIEDAVDYLRSISRAGREIEGQVPPFRLNFIVEDPKDVAMPIDLQMSAVRLDQLCNRIAQAAGLRVAFDSDAIVFSSDDGKAEQAADGNTKPSS